MLSIPSNKKTKDEELPPHLNRSTATRQHATRLLRRTFVLSCHGKHTGSTPPNTPTHRLLVVQPLSTSHAAGQGARTHGFFFGPLAGWLSSFSSLCRDDDLEIPECCQKEEVGTQASKPPLPNTQHITPHTALEHHAGGHVHGGGPGAPKRRRRSTALLKQASKPPLPPSHPLPSHTTHNTPHIQPSSTMPVDMCTAAARGRQKEEEEVLPSSSKQASHPSLPHTLSPHT